MSVLHRATVPALGLVDPPPAVGLCCLGRFAAVVDGTVLDLAGLRPRARSLLRWLAAEGGRPVHREVLVQGLWPEARTTAAAMRKLHVAVSSLRGPLAPATKVLGRPLVARDGQSYLVDLGGDVTVDVAQLRDRLHRARTLRRSDPFRAAVALEEALDLHVGPLLPEEGPTDWVVERRAELEQDLATAAEDLALLLDQLGAEPADVIAACERGLAIDRFRDGLWRLAIEAHLRRGDIARAARTRRSYAAVLTELGLGHGAAAYEAAG